MEEGECFSRTVVKEQLVVRRDTLAGHSRRFAKAILNLYFSLSLRPSHRATKLLFALLLRFARDPRPVHRRQIDGSDLKLLSSFLPSFGFDHYSHTRNFLFVFDYAHYGSPDREDISPLSVNRRCFNSTSLREYLR